MPRNGENDIMQNRLQIIDRLLCHWQQLSVPLLPPPAQAEVEAVWRQLNRPLSADVVALYTAVGGFDRDYYDDRVWSLWSIERVAEENAVRPGLGVMFSDFLIDSHAYSLRFEDVNRSSVWLGASADGELHMASGLVEFLERYL